MIDSDCLTSLLFYSHSFLDRSSSCQLFPFFSLYLISLPLVSCVSLPSYFTFLETSFAFLQVALPILVSHQVKFGILLFTFLHFGGPHASRAGKVKISLSIFSVE